MGRQEIHLLTYSIKRRRVPRWLVVPVLIFGLAGAAHLLRPYWWPSVVERYHEWSIRRAIEAMRVQGPKLAGAARSEQSDALHESLRRTWRGLWEDHSVSTGTPNPYLRHWKPIHWTTRLLVVAERTDGTTPPPRYLVIAGHTEAGDLHIESWSISKSAPATAFAAGPLIVPIQDPAAAKQIQFKPAQIDRSNASRFILPYTIGDEEGQLIGQVHWLGEIDWTAPGWWQSTGWWPTVGGLEALESAAATKKLSLENSYSAVAFLPDGSLALARADRIDILALEDPVRLVQSHSIPHLVQRAADVFVFSQDGTRAFVGGASQPWSVLDVATGHVLVSSDTLGCAGDPWPSFPDQDTFILADNNTVCTWDLRTGTVVSSEPARRWQLAVGAGVSAYDEPGKGGVIEAASGLRRFEAIRGMHSLSIAPSGEMIAAKGEWGAAVYDVKSGQRKWHHSRDTDWHTSRARVKWSSDSRLLWELEIVRHDEAAITPP